MWQILTTNSMKGNVLKLSIVFMHNTFDSPVGLWQGCLLFPIIFSIYANQLSKIIENSDICGIPLFLNITEILLLLFADVIALITDYIRGLQKQIDITEKFCDTYKIVVTTIKTKSYGIQTKW